MSEQKMQRPKNVPLKYDDLFVDINRGHIKVPRFQREFVWNKEQTSRLIDSLIKENSSNLSYRVSRTLVSPSLDTILADLNYILTVDPKNCFANSLMGIFTHWNNEFEESTQFLTRAELNFNIKEKKGDSSKRFHKNFKIDLSSI